MLVKKSKDGKASSREKNLLDRSTSRWEDFFIRLEALLRGRKDGRKPKKIGKT